jgi:hypothetical protein
VGWELKNNMRVWHTAQRTHCKEAAAAAYVLDSMLLRTHCEKLLQLHVSYTASAHTGKLSPTSHTSYSCQASSPLHHTCVSPLCQRPLHPIQSLLKFALQVVRQGSTLAGTGPDQGPADTRATHMCAAVRVLSRHPGPRTPCQPAVHIVGRPCTSS